MILRLATAPARNLECAKRHPLDRSHYKMRHVILGQPRPQVRRYEKGLVTIKQNKTRHADTLPQNIALGYTNLTAG